METTKKQQALAIFTAMDGMNKEVKRKDLIQALVDQIECCSKGYAATMVQLMRSGKWVQETKEEQSGS